MHSITPSPVATQNMNYNKVIYFLIGAAALLAFPLLYLVLTPPGQPPLSPSQWLLFGALALAVVLAAIMPIIIYRVRRARGLPPEHVSASDLRFVIALIAVLTFTAALIAPTMTRARTTAATSRRPNG